MSVFPRPVLLKYFNKTLAHFVEVVYLCGGPVQVRVCYVPDIESNQSHSKIKH